MIPGSAGTARLFAGQFVDGCGGVLPLDGPIPDQEFLTRQYSMSDSRVITQRRFDNEIVASAVPGH
jgi:hypothetical protein